MGGRPFRRWLADRLLGTEYARTPIRDDQIDDVAKSIGVDPDLLVEVRMRARLMRAADGLQEPMGVKKRGTRHYQCRLPIPKEMLALWKEECEFRGVDGSALLRSMIHQYLLGSREPSEGALRHWYYKGRRYAVRPENRYAEKALITNGAWRALKRRSHRLGCSATAIMRALVLEAMEGGHRRIVLIDARMMYDDEDRYYLGENVAD